jgi:SlyX protein|tara:strand:+ start:2281 stop:2484 length:204 start_codon:yes stop_codon:yes gene_type:complete
MPDDHLVKIETKLSYQEDLLDQLNSIIIRQQKEIDSLKRELLLLQEKITTINESTENVDMDERPPHY